MLHHCCAPCSPSVVDGFSADHPLTGFWFNPNIHPEEEHRLRFSSLERYLSERSIGLIVGGLMTPEQWLATAPADVPGRCAFCYRLRLSATARRAREEGFSHFSTTLLASPYQKHGLVNSIGEECARQEGVTFVYRDFRARFYEGKKAARDAGSYMQKYCGCSFSREERISRSK